MLGDTQFIRNPDGTVSIDSDYIVRLAEFKIKYEEFLRRTK